MDLIQDRLRRVLGKTTTWTEFRYHGRRMRTFGVRKGEVDVMSSKEYEGVGIRVLKNGTWGFSTTSQLTIPGLEAALKTAEKMADELQSRKKKKVVLGSSSRLAKGEFIVEGFDELDAMSLEEKFAVVRNTEERLRKGAKGIEAASCRYSEIFEDKWILTTDGVDCHVKIAQPELRLVAFGADGSRKAVGLESVGGAGNWNCLFANYPLEHLLDETLKSTLEQLRASEAEGGKKKVILSPAMVGLLSHEAIGHTVEADFVNAGSVAAGKIGKEVASSLVTLCDSGKSEHIGGATGSIPVDDEGVLTARTEIIKDGVLTSYLHNRESAKHYGVEPTGNGRAWQFDDEPLIRMRNTYIEPGNDSLEEMIDGISDGYYIDGPGSGQADSTAEFMFGARKVRKIKNGKLGETVKELSVSGNAFDVLKSVDAVSKDFKWDLGSGHCGKGQLAKVDAGGPYLRCELLVGGAQK